MESKMGKESMSSLAGKDATTIYMGGGSQADIQSGPDQGWPSGASSKGKNVDVSAPTDNSNMDE